MNEEIKKIEQHIQQAKCDAYMSACKLDLSETDDDSLNKFHCISLQESILMDKNIKSDECPIYSLQSLKKRSALKRHMFDQIEKLNELNVSRLYAQVDDLISKINNLLDK